MKFFITSFICLLSAFCTSAQLLSWEPDFIEDANNSGNVVITMDANKGNKGLLGYATTGDVYVHIGVITNLSTSSSDWKHSKFSWGTTDANANAVYQGSNKWAYTIGGGLRNYFGVADNEQILKIAILFRSGNGNLVQRNADGSDMYIPVYQDGALAVMITEPFRQPKYSPVPETITKNVGDAISITAKSSAAATLKLYLNGVQVGSTVASGTSIAANPPIVQAGSQQIIAEATSGVIKRDTISFYVAGQVEVLPQPANTRDGINYLAGGSSVTLVLYAPNKTRVSVIGDFNNWTETSPYQMKRTPDGLRYWLTINDLTPGSEYGFQYLIDGVLAVADIYSEKILDPWNDQYLSPLTYPNLKSYPVGKTTGIVSVLQTNKAAYAWDICNFSKPNKNNLVIYELLVRDFVATQRWKTVKDSLPYLSKLGITAIELMPVNEFEGNNSWGYNPDFYFAPDKNYGTENDFREFIDACHKNGIAVIMDMALNHAFGLSPTVQMYFNSATNKPAADNPWHNVDARHPFNVGYDFNHEAQPTKDLVDRVIEHWLLNYKVDGFRWDLSKGFTQTNSGADVGYWGQYDQGRVNTWKRIYDKMQATSAGSYCILEHFADAPEENELANYGMMLWRNRNHAYNQGTMGYDTESDFGWSAPNFITYQESHDEERLMWKNYLYGKSTTGPPPYSTTSSVTALQRMGMAASFWAMQPFPKMMWQFEELGYDSSINSCNNGQPISNDCRTNPKPILWDYLKVANRKALYDVYSKLLALRKVPNYLPTFTSTSISGSLGGYFKWFQVTTNALKICVIGNFDVVSQTGTVTFQNAGTWYTYVAGGTQFPTSRVATGAAESITLAAGEYYVFLDRDPGADLSSVQVYTFIGNGSWSNNANWTGGKVPPATLLTGSQIIIAPVADGECVLDVTQNIQPGARISVECGKRFRIPGLLNNL